MIKHQRPNSCEGCPLHLTSQPGFCPDKIPAKAKILMMAEAPGKNEIIDGEPMVGKAGFVLKQWLIHAVPELKIAMDKQEIGFANTLRCLPIEVQGRPYPKGKDKEAAEAHCRQYDVFPDTVQTVILFGEHSQRLYFKEELEAEDAVSRQLGHEAKGVMGRLGRVYEKDGKRYVFAPHPAYILRQPALVQHGQESLKIAVGKDKLVEPDYIRWDQAMQELMEEQNAEHE